MTMQTAPGYRLKGRTYKTVTGLSTALMKDCGCTSHSMVADRTITCWIGRKSNNTQQVVARYTVSPPEAGKPMDVVRVYTGPLTTPASELRRIHGPRVGNALHVLNEYIAKGMEYPDAEWRVLEAGGITDDAFVKALRAAYGAQS